jgi:mono/diheme cytochrome c family protein
MLLSLLISLSHAADAEAGKASYDMFCATCHGAAGAGDGVAGAALTPKPANFTDAAFWEGKTDEGLTKIIAEGGAANGLSPLMPPFGAALDAAKTADVVAYLNTFKP